MTFDSEKELMEMVVRQFGIEHRDEKVDLITLVADRVAQLLDAEPELLFSALYRLDVDEAKVRSVIDEPTEEPVNFRIAKLILERQRKRMETKQAYKPPPVDDDWAF